MGNPDHGITYTYTKSRVNRLMMRVRYDSHIHSHLCLSPFGPTNLFDPLAAGLTSSLLEMLPIPYIQRLFPPTEKSFSFSKSGRIAVHMIERLEIIDARCCASGAESAKVGPEEAGGRRGRWGTPTIYVYSIESRLMMRVGHDSRIHSHLCLSPSGPADVFDPLAAGLISRVLEMVHPNPLHSNPKPIWPIMLKLTYQLLLS